MFFFGEEGQENTLKKMDDYDIFVSKQKAEKLSVQQHDREIDTAPSPDKKRVELINIQ